MLLPEALRDALGQIIANERREWRRERELIEAQARTAIAELQAANLALTARLEEMVAARLATLRDGRDGADGRDGKDGRDGIDGKDGAAGAPGERGADGRDGVDGAPGERGPPGEMGERGERGAPGESGRDGADGRDGLDGAAGERGEPGPQGIPGERGERGIDGANGEDGRDGLDGAPGERGADGAPGKLPMVRAWEDRVHYEGDVVILAGSVFQAQRDTGRAPPHDDWVCIAAAGRDGQDGRSFTIRGTWAEGQTYRNLDVVALNGAAFAARSDDPGTCPGEGWQMIASQGKRGQPGERGLRGEPGPPGSSVVDLTIDDEGLLVLTNADRSTASLDLYPLLGRIAG